MKPQVIIVGAGPVGLTLANLLGLYGIRTLVVEKDLASPDAPRAVSLDDESLRIWQQCGLLDKMAPFIAEGGEGDVVFTYRTRTGRPIFTMTQRGRPYGYARGNVFLFHRVLEVLTAGLQRFPHVALQTGWTVLDGDERDGCARLTAVDGNGRQHELVADYLVGCDGGRSAIRNSLQIAMQGSAYTESWLIVDTVDPDRAGQPLDEGVEVWCDPRCPTASIPLPGGYRRWEFLLRAQANGEGAPDDQHIRQLMAQRKPHGSTQIVRRLLHTYKACVAEYYGRGRLFLAGDAAHLSPPFAGQGMATGLRDAVNLAWKLAYVLQGQATPRLLASYEQERRPHQVKMLKLARRMGSMMMPGTRLHETLIALLFTVAGRFAWLRRAMEIRGVNVTPVYAPDDKKQAGRAGHYLLQPELGSGRLLDGLLGMHYSVMTFDRPPQQALSSEEYAHWQRQGAAFLWLRPVGDTAAAYRMFQEWLGDCRGRLLIIRPDRFVAEDRALSIR